jgi:hypothetical protein
MSSPCKPQSLASEALEKALNFVPDHVISMDKPMIRTTALKRSRNTLGSFGMSDFEDAAKQVEESIAFPSIEWNFNDDDDEEFTQPSKRRCQGLARSSESFDLTALGSFQRRGSNNSFC